MRFKKLKPLVTDAGIEAARERIAPVLTITGPGKGNRLKGTRKELAIQSQLVDEANELNDRMTRDIKILEGESGRLK